LARISRDYSRRIPIRVYSDFVSRGPGGGITGMPAFEIGGRLLVGAQPREALEAAIADARLRVSGAGRARGPEGRAAAGESHWSHAPPGPVRGEFTPMNKGTRTRPVWRIARKDLADRMKKKKDDVTDEHKSARGFGEG
jgi:hypothetical protein